MSVPASSNPVPLSVAELRVSYSRQGLDDATLSDDPIALFTKWVQEAADAKEPEPNAMCLSTADENGRPAARIVLLKGFDDAGFVWYTNYQSRKASHLALNPFAALTFWWASLERSVRIEGAVVRLPAEESDAYFSSRPLGSRLGALASDQSRPIESRDELEQRMCTLEAQHMGSDGEPVKIVERPQHWGGYRLIPERIEFWKGRESRLHDRIVYQCAAADSAAPGTKWSRSRLQP